MIIFINVTNEIILALFLSTASSTVSRPTTSTTVYAQIGLENAVIKAEIVWALKMVSSNFSYNSCSDIPATFKRMFEECPTAQSFAMADRKASYVIQYGLAPYFENLLMEQVRNVGDFVLLFDESLNKITHTKQMDIHVRYWQQENNQVQTRYMKSVYMGHGTADDMMEHFDKGVSNVKGLLHNLLQLSMDGPNVNWKFHRMFCENLEKDCKSNIIDIGSCGLHIVHGAFKNGACILDTDQILSSLHWLFKDSPARRQDFTAVTGVSDFPMKFCKHRWVENLPVATRALQIWPSVKLYVECVEKKKLKHSQNKSYETIKDACKNPLTEAKLAFFKRLARSVNPLLTKFQSDKPMVPFLCSSMTDMILELIEIFIKQQELQKVRRFTRKVMALDVGSTDLHVTYKQVDVGLETEMHVKEAAKKVSEARLMDFRMKCKESVVAVVKKLQEKAPVKYSLVRHLRCLDPKRMHDEVDLCVADMKEVLKLLHEVRKIDLDKCDIVLAEYKKMLRNENFEGFDCDRDRLDVFLYNIVSKQKEYTTVWSVIKKLLILSHGQASVERGFSYNKAIERENLPENSFTALRIVKDSIIVAGGHLEVPVTPKMIVSVGSARARYMEDLRQKKEEKETAERGLKRQGIVDEIEELKKKRARLEHDKEAMLKSADELCEQAEVNRKMTLVVQANSMRKTAKEKAVSVDKINKELDERLKELKGH